MLAGHGDAPLGLEEEVTAADPRSRYAGESFLTAVDVEGPLDLGRHGLAKGFGQVVPDLAPWSQAPSWPPEASFLRRPPPSCG